MYHESRRETTRLVSQLFSAKFDVLQAEIECLSEPREIIKLDFAVEGSEFVLRPELLKSKPGLYRLTVRTNRTGEHSPNSVHDLFEVTNINFKPISKIAQTL